MLEIYQRSMLQELKKKTDQLLTDIKAYQKYFVQNELFGIVELGKALDFLIYDMKKNSEDNRLIYPIKKNVKISRTKINLGMNQ